MFMIIHNLHVASAICAKVMFMIGCYDLCVLPLSGFMAEHDMIFLVCIELSWKLSYVCRLL